MIDSKKAGFTLIEVLISVFVLALGIIGVAGMQLTAMRTSQQSAIQTVALQLASELADKMRANAKMMQESAGTNPFFRKLDKYKATDTTSAFSKNCYQNTCAPAELADFDIHEFQIRVQQVLPGGQVQVCNDSAAAPDGGIKKYDWTCSANPNPNEPNTIAIKIGWLAKKPDGKYDDINSSEFRPSVVLTVEPYQK